MTLTPTTPLTPLVNRLHKNLREIKKSLKKTNTEAYRLYQKDIPEFPYIMECYANHWVIWVKSKQEWDIDAETARLKDLEIALKEAFPSIKSITIKHRKRQEGESQYERLNRVSAPLVCRENDMAFLINLTDYLDTGLFLDHRPMRNAFKNIKWQSFDSPQNTPLQKNDSPPHLLNLFCYTGSVSIAAAHAGWFTTNVDMSASYLRWAQDNMGLNRLTPSTHRWHQEDALTWLHQAAQGHWQSCDAIFFDPPSFSNSKRMEDTWDVQRDHSILLPQLLPLLKANGILIFSTNKSKFHLDWEPSTQWQMLDVTEPSTPKDFRGTPHHCYFIYAADSTVAAARVGEMKRLLRS